MSAARLSAVLLLAACTPRPADQAPGAPEPSMPESSAPAQGDEAPVITLERTPCYGTCPVYRLAIGRDGLVRFTGLRHTSVIGDTTARIPAGRVDSLLAELRAEGYFEMSDAYVSGDPACGRYATDSPSAITSVVEAGERKEIRHDYGCAGAPPTLTALERRIDDVAGSGVWIGR